MPYPRPISTEKREEEIQNIRQKLCRQAEKLDDVISDLSKPHVDDKTAAKSLLSEAKKLRRGLPD